MSQRFMRGAALLAAITAASVGGCSSNDEPSASEDAAPTTAPPAPDDAAPTTEPPAPEPPADADSADASARLPEREGPRRETTGDVPHIQLDATLVPEVDAELRRRVFQLPGVEDLPSNRSLPGARGLALSDDLDLVRPDVISGSSEFAHIHPDGSLHVWLPVDRALDVHATKWGEVHPWADREGFWDGVTMLYTPESMEELETTIRIVVDAYNFVTGANLDPSDIP